MCDAELRPMKTNTTVQRGGLVTDLVGWNRSNSLRFPVFLPVLLVSGSRSAIRDYFLAMLWSFARSECYSELQSGCMH